MKLYKGIFGNKQRVSIDMFKAAHWYPAHLPFSYYGELYKETNRIIHSMNSVWLPLWIILRTGQPHWPLVVLFDTNGAPSAVSGSVPLTSEYSSGLNNIHSYSAIAWPASLTCLRAVRLLLISKRDSPLTCFSRFASLRFFTSLHLLTFRSTSLLIVPSYHTLTRCSSSLLSSPLCR